MKPSIRAVALDRLVGQTVPSFTTDDEVRAFEAVPFAQRIDARSTFEALAIGAALDPGSPAIRFLPNADADEAPVTLSHRDFLARVIQSANLFHSLGVGPGDVVSLLLPLVPQSFYALFGAEAAGIANPVNPMLEPHQLVEILQAADTRVLVALGPVPGTDIHRKVEQIRERLPGLRTILWVGGDPAQREQGALGFDEQLAPMPADHLASQRQIGATDIAAYFHTGGTTGTPKLVRHTHANQVYQAWAMNLMLPSRGNDTLLFGLPLFHVGGALTQALATLTHGGSLVVLSPAGWRHPNAVRQLWRLVQRYRPTTFSAVPTVLTAAASVPVGDCDVSSLQASAGGGSAIPVAVGKALEKQLGRPVLEVYGMTETASVHTLAFLGRPVRLGSAGHPLPYSRVRIVRLDGEGQLVGDCASGEIGVVAMHGPGVFAGYLDERHNAGAFIEPGWVNSGDLGRLDDQGYLWITGRAKDLIIRGGHNIDPAGVEEVLYQHPAVALAAVVGQPDAYAGELPLAYVQRKPGLDTGRDELLAHVRAHTPERAAVPVDLLFVDEIPLTGVGKVFKPELRRDAAQRVFAATLAPLSERATISVEVGSHGTHGSLATVSVGDVAIERRDEIARAISSLLDPFVMPHRIAWR
ncbi:MAG: acyl-CoA synthetase [Burkholderiaceae bacterium]